MLKNCVCGWTKPVLIDPRQANPGLHGRQLSARTGEGMDRWLDGISQALAAHGAEAFA